MNYPPTKTTYGKLEGGREDASGIQFICSKNKNQKKPTRSEKREKRLIRSAFGKKNIPAVLRLYQRGVKECGADSSESPLLRK